MLSSIASALSRESRGKPSGGGTSFRSKGLSLLLPRAPAVLGRAWGGLESDSLLSAPLRSVFRARPPHGKLVG
eukprot:817544-Prorocentrum_minimum.AAC.1